MSKGTIIKKGGGTGKLFAAIKANYPAGSICTATNGTKTLKAEDTSGVALFAIPEPETLPETWTVTATDGTNTKSQSVSITAEGQLESATLSYQLDLLTTDSGLADGYSVSGTAVSPAIDVTNYSTLTIVAQIVWLSASGMTLDIGLKSTTGGDLVACKTISSTSKETLSLDISSLSGLYYLGADYSMSYVDGAIGLESGGASATVYSLKFV